jgi:hypothetical protein
MVEIRMSKIVMQEQMNQREGIGDGGKERPEDTSHPPLRVLMDRISNIKQ